MLSVGDKKMTFITTDAARRNSSKCFKPQVFATSENPCNLIFVDKLHNVQTDALLLKIKKEKRCNVEICRNIIFLCPIGCWYPHLTTLEWHK